MFSLLSIFLLALLIVYKAKEDITIAIPVSVSAHILMALVLGLVRGLAWMGIISFCLSLLGLIVLAPRSLSGCKSYVRELIRIVCNPRCLFLVLVLVVVAILTEDHIAVWWDDINFWSTDAKSIYYLKGFPGRYGNVAPEFGDYPPGIQLFKYFFLSLKPYYKEGLDFAGYYCFNIIFLLPLWGMFKDKHQHIQLPALLIILLLPGVVSSIWSTGTCADLGAATVYCALLITILDGDRNKTPTNIIDTGLFAAVLILCKNTGFQWVVFACALMIALNISSRGQSKARLLIPCAFAASSAALWWGYCLINRRIGRQTVNSVKIATNKNYSILDIAMEKTSIFFKGLLYCPLHTDRTILFDISFVGIFAGLIILLLLLARYGKLKRRMSVTILTYMIATGIISVGMVYYAHLTIFANETQYSTPEIMTISISRYCLPYTLSALVILAYLLIRYIDSAKVIAIMAIGVMLTTDYSAYHMALWGYRVSYEEDYMMRNNMLGESAMDYAKRVASDTALWGKRVLYLREESDNRWVENTYLNREVSPVATVYGVVGRDTLVEDILRQYREQHAHYVYIDGTAFESDSESYPLEFDEILRIDDRDEGVTFGVVLPTATYMLN